MRLTLSEASALLHRGVVKPAACNARVKLPVPDEDHEQRMLAGYLDLLRVRWCHVPNGGARDSVTGARLKSHGVKRGVPDVLIFTAPPSYPESPGVAIELKRIAGGKVSPEQRDWLGFLESRGWCCAVCNGWEGAQRFLEGLGWKTTLAITPKQ